MPASQDASNRDYVLFGSFDSANLIVRHVLEELGIAYRFEEVNRANRMNWAPTYLRVNPQGLLPVLFDPVTQTPAFETAAPALSCR